MTRTAAPSQRLAELGLTLPDVPAPVAAYVPAIRYGELVHTSGQLPMAEGRLLGTGLVGRDVAVDEAAALARQCALNALAAIAALIGGIDRVEQVVTLTGFVACPPDFTAQPAVVNGASELLLAVFGDAGRHARSAVGVAALPLNAPVEIELVARAGGGTS
jgi:enamine deaminase RidA (YjgF/YER057c/UK114 family)